MSKATFYRYEFDKLAFPNPMYDAYVNPSPKPVYPLDAEELSKNT